MARRAALLLLFACGAPPALADEAPAHPFKLTLGAYHFSGGTDGVDLNLRHTSDWGNAWVGYYREPGGDVPRQWRTGWDRGFGEAVRITPSVQLASGGFAGGSLQAEAGEPWFAGVGFGRTNLHPYVNLNFDPNDSYLLYAGHRGADGSVATASMVRDNRENPDQRHYHLTFRTPLPGGDRLTLDLLRKEGTVEGEFIRRWGATATYDWPRFFVRLARDPKTNFTPVDAWRFSVGARF
jgi:hypothetical protein